MMRLIANLLLVAMATVFSTTPVIAADAKKSDALAASASRSSFIDQTKRYTAWKVATLLENRKFGAILDCHLSTGKHRAGFDLLLNDYSVVSAQEKSDATELRNMDRDLRESKGIESRSQSLRAAAVYAQEFRRKSRLESTPGRLCACGQGEDVEVR